jgi:hypothetical protein
VIKNVLRALPALALSVIPLAAPAAAAPAGALVTSCRRLWHTLFRLGKALVAPGACFERPLHTRSRQPVAGVP